MATPGGGLAVGGDVEQALAGIPVPSYVLDTDGSRPLDQPGGRAAPGRRSRTALHLHRRRRRTGRAPSELFARKVLGTTAATETSGVLVSRDGTRLTLEVSAVPLKGGDRVVGVFGSSPAPLDEEASTPPHT